MKTTPHNISLVKLLLVLCGALVAFDHRAAAAPGDLDLTFGGTGIVTTSFDTDGHVNAVALQPDGRIVALGYRYNANQQLRSDSEKPHEVRKILVPLKIGEDFD